MNETLTTGAEILAACEKVSTDGEVTGVHRTYSSLEYCPGKSVPGSGERTGFGLRIIRNGKLGVSGEWGIAKPFSLLEKAIGNCRYGEEALFSFPSDSPESGSSTGSELENLTHDDVLIYLHELQAQIRNIHPSACLSAGIQLSRAARQLFENKSIHPIFGNSALRYRASAVGLHNRNNCCSAPVIGCCNRTYASTAS
jgi:hypothetical protein